MSTKEETYPFPPSSQKLKVHYLY
ncbi:unnamed protein product [Spirodela intermedia]|uniref:Uncharacterized protein n=1 Tax=Spirodela intermedia TaxID=51605 RepID=A0A7I8LLQ2_SPIIN|nr:unnamed protein product [Spirodela intermedia]